MLQTKVKFREDLVLLVVHAPVHLPREPLLPHVEDMLRAEAAHQDQLQRCHDRETLPQQDLALTFTIEPRLRIEADLLHLCERNHPLVTRRASLEGHNRDLVTLPALACIMKRRNHCEIRRRRTTIRLMYLIRRWTRWTSQKSWNRL